MIKYVAVALAIVFLAVPAQAQEPDVMSIYLISQEVGGLERNVFSRYNYTTQQILQDLLYILDQTNLQQVITRFGGENGYEPSFIKGDTAQLRTDLDYLLNTFPQAAGVFDQPLAVGEKSFVDEFGNYFTTDEPELFTPLPYTTTYSLTFYAGRGTAAADILEALENVEIVTRGNRYRIFALDTQSATPIPSLNQWGALVLMLLLGIAAFRALRKQRA